MTGILARHVSLPAALSQFPGITNLQELLAAIATATGVRYPPLAGEVGITDQAWPYGHPHRYGGVGDDTANDRVAVQNAIDSAAPTGAGFRYVLLDPRFQYRATNAAAALSGTSGGHIPWAWRLRSDVALMGLGGRGRLRAPGKGCQLFLMGNYYNSLWGEADADVCNAVTAPTRTLVIPKPQTNAWGGAAPAYNFSVGQTVIIKSVGSTNEDAYYDWLRFADAKRIVAKVETSGSITLTLDSPFDEDVPDPCVMPANGVRDSVFGQGSLILPERIVLQSLHLIHDTANEIAGPFSCVKNGLFRDLYMEECFYVGGNFCNDSTWENIEGTLAGNALEFAGNSRRVRAKGLRGWQNKYAGGVGAIAVVERSRFVQIDDVQINAGTFLETTTTAAFNQPLGITPVNVDVVSTTALAEVMPWKVRIAGGGAYQLVAINSATQIRVKNLQYGGNASVGTNIPAGASVTAGGLAPVHIEDARDVTIGDGKWVGKTRMEALRLGVAGKSGYNSANVADVFGVTLHDFDFHLAECPQHINVLADAASPAKLRDSTVRNVRFFGPQPTNAARTGGQRMTWQDLYIENGSLRILDGDWGGNAMLPDGSSYKGITLKNGRILAGLGNSGHTTPELVGNLSVAETHDDLYSLLRRRDIRLEGCRGLGDKEWLALRRISSRNLTTTSTTYVQAYNQLLAGVDFRPGDLLRIRAIGYATGAAGQVRISLWYGGGPTEVVVAEISVPSTAGDVAWEIDGHLVPVQNQSGANYSLFASFTARTSTGVTSYGKRIANTSTYWGDSNFRVSLSYRTTNSGSTMGLSGFSIVPVRPGVSDIGGIE